MNLQLQLSNRMKKDWNEKCIEKTLISSGSRLTSNYDVISTMKNECTEKEDDIELIKTLFSGLANVGRTWNNKLVDQVNAVTITTWFK